MANPASDSRGADCGRTLSLPVIPAGRGGPVRPSKMGGRRAAVLIGVHVLIIAHLLHWTFAGTTLSPIEPSEAMETLNFGRVNAGALFFALALLTTLLFGRWVCGWACHIVALQDLCGWLLKKIGLRPKPFRSRVLMFVPLGAALYMFVYPSVVRWWAGVPRPTLTNHVMKADFWETFPGPVVAVLTFAFCGFGIVYFLGNKGFCTYACPYGGFFAVLDRLAPLRIRVSDACNQCGHCTAVCSSNVRVAEEVRLFRMVVDPGCMKCMDCVSVCPNNALRVGWGRPATLARPREPRRAIRWDGSRLEELGLAVVFLAALFCYRGLYGQVPFLFSLGLAAMTAYLALKAWHLVARRDASMHGFVLKRGGTLRPAGRTYLAAIGLLGLFLAHSGAMQFASWRGLKAFEQVTPAVGGWFFAPSLRPLISPQESAAADLAAARLGLIDRWGLFPWSETNLAQAWIDVLRDAPDAAERRLRREVRAAPDSPIALEALAAIHVRQGRLADGIATIERAIQLKPGNPAGHFTLGLLRLRENDAAAAERSLAESIRCAQQAAPDESVALDPLTFVYHAEALRRLGRLDDALQQLTQSPGDPTLLQAHTARALRLEPDSPALLRALAAQLAQQRSFSQAEQILARLAARDPNDYIAHMLLGRIRMQADDRAGALRHYARAETAGPNAWTVQSDLATVLALERRFDEALQRGRRAAALNPNAAEVRANLGAVLVSKGDLAAATEEYRAAARLAPQDLEHRLRIGMLLAMQGQSAEAAAELRAVAAGAPIPELRAAAAAELAKLEAGTAVPRP